VLGLTAWVGDDENDGFTFNPTAAIAATLLFVMACTFIFAGVWGTDRAHRLAAELVVNQAAPKDYTESDPNHIPLMSSEMALQKARQGMNQVQIKDVGDFQGNKTTNASSIFEVNEGTFQSINNHIYWIFAPRPTGWRNSNKVDGIVPFYMKVDAEDPNQAAVAVMKDDQGGRIAIRYSPAGYYSHDLERYVWNKYHSKVRNDATLEIDDQGRPFYTLSKDRLTLNHQSTLPATLLLVNAQTGQIEEKKLTEVPDWVDRVYSQDTVKDMVGWWGEWANATWQISEQSANRYKVSGDPVLVYARGGHPSFQVILTSYNSDTSASYLMMVDARTGKADSFQIPNLTLSSVASNAITKSAAQKGKNKLVPSHLVLYSVYGQLTWASPLEAEEDDHHIYQGMALVSATDPNGSTVVIGTSKASALEQYRQMVARGQGTNVNPESGGNFKTMAGTVQYVNAIVENGNTVFYFGLAEDKSYQFKATPNDDMPELRSIHIGAKVRVGYLDVGGKRLDVGSYDDVAIG
jgi:hypothetical protein